VAFSAGSQTFRPHLLGKLDTEGKRTYEEGTLEAQVLEIRIVHPSFSGQI
jgi:hypothetical protein